MYKIKKPLISILCLIPLITFAKEKYNPDDLKKFESTGICVKCDLSYAHINGGSHPHVNVQGSNLTGTSTITSGGDTGWDYSVSNFSGIDGTGMNFGFDDFTGSSFKNARLRGAILYDTNFTNVDFSGADVAGVDFGGANLYGSNLTDAQLETVKSLCNATLPDGSRGPYPCNK